MNASERLLFEAKQAVYNEIKLYKGGKATMIGVEHRVLDLEYALIVWARREGVLVERRKWRRREEQLMDDGGFLPVGHRPFFWPDEVADTPFEGAGERTYWGTLRANPPRPRDRRPRHRVRHRP